MQESRTPAKVMQVFQIYWCGWRMLLVVSTPSFIYPDAHFAFFIGKCLLVPLQLLQLFQTYCYGWSVQHSCLHCALHVPLCAYLMCMFCMQFIYESIYLFLCRLSSFSRGAAMDGILSLVLSSFYLFIHFIYSSLLCLFYAVNVFVVYL